jgi:hypothetical protein
MRTWLIFAALVLAGCGSTAPVPETKAAAPAPPPVKDDTALLLTENRVSASVVPDHLLGNKVLPGGSFGEYAAGQKKYQLFVLQTGSAQDAAILLLDYKGTLTDSAYIAYMGGYSGADGGKPVFVFAKGKYLAGVAGLVPGAADPIARQLAARIR